jgi:hypothetical protein
MWNCESCKDKTICQGNSNFLPTKFWNHLQTVKTWDSWKTVLENCIFDFDAGQVYLADYLPILKIKGDIIHLLYFIVRKKITSQISHNLENQEIMFSSNLFCVKIEDVVLMNGLSTFTVRKWFQTFVGKKMLCARHCFIYHFQIHLMINSKYLSDTWDDVIMSNHALDLVGARPVPVALAGTL